MIHNSGRYILYALVITLPKGPTAQSAHIGGPLWSSGFGDDTAGGGHAANKTQFWHIQQIMNHVMALQTI